MISGGSCLLTSDEVVHKGGGHVEDAHQQVADGQVGKINMLVIRQDVLLL